ncbi:unnamed protein product [Acanthosepion pharaonis]|uniref:Uncharacterized protein n=1 Tax=Acanthosepion pharaonis TaxID=158019 RepID=A0A812CGR8_ACAPH|nr:unnamed protein product [Sepia pharaonis]
MSSLSCCPSTYTMSQWRWSTASVWLLAGAGGAAASSSSSTSSRISYSEAIKWYHLFLSILLDKGCTQDLPPTVPHCSLRDCHPGLGYQVGGVLQSQLLQVVCDGTSITSFLSGYFTKICPSGVLRVLAARWVLQMSNSRTAFSGRFHERRCLLTLGTKSSKNQLLKISAVIQLLAELEYSTERVAIFKWWMHLGDKNFLNQELQLVGPSSIAGEQNGDVVLCLLEALGLVDVILHGQGSVRERLVELLLGLGLLHQELLQLRWEGVCCLCVG